MKSPKPNSKILNLVLGRQSWSYSPNSLESQDTFISSPTFIFFFFAPHSLYYIFLPFSLTPRASLLPHPQPLLSFSLPHLVFSPLPDRRPCVPPLCHPPPRSPPCAPSSSFLHLHPFPCRPPPRTPLCRPPYLKAPHYFTALPPPPPSPISASLTPIWPLSLHRPRSSSRLLLTPPRIALSPPPSLGRALPLASSLPCRGWVVCLQFLLEFEMLNMTVEGGMIPDVVGVKRSTGSLSSTPRFLNSHSPSSSSLVFASSTSSFSRSTSFFHRVSSPTCVNLSASSIRFSLDRFVSPNRSIAVSSQWRPDKPTHHHKRTTIEPRFGCLLRF
ncbi:hypothetical protein Fmac_014588 [Flemingia macrophylla]|uniref:Uncharacterized protein n=1 Tax=Flemingia macrophylla TaxID=520843 RepID=A0ABD1MC71_9FABA